MTVRSAHIGAIPVSAGEREPGKAAWIPVRAHFGIMSFGISAYRAGAAGERLAGAHSETNARHEELFFVATGHARFTVDGEEGAAPAGTFVHVANPAAVRGAVAVADGTSVVAVGGEPGAAFTVSPCESESLGSDAAPAGG